MSYARALEKAWQDLLDLAKDGNLTVKMLSDTYTIDPLNKKVSAPSGKPGPKDYTTILLLHYLIKKIRLGGMPKPSGQWIDFRSLEGGEAYYPTFKKRTIDHIAKKYSSSGDVAKVADVFESVPMLIKISAADEEFGADASILFDKTISQIFCTEDIVVLTEIVVHKL